jgi:glucose-6-phosphate dehydrogenase assembly protein OpcA
MFKFTSMKKVIAFICLSAILLTVAGAAQAQCAMCQATAETSLEAGASAAAGINKGVLYLFVTPYLVAATIFFFWWRARKRVEASSPKQII